MACAAACTLPGSSVALPLNPFLVARDKIGIRIWRTIALISGCGGFGKSKLLKCQPSIVLVEGRFEHG